MYYSLITLWYERQRYLPAILAVAFSALLIAVQSGLLLGIFAVVTLPVDHARADVWLGPPDLPSVDAGQPIPRRWASRLNLPQIVQFEFYEQGYANWHKRSGGIEQCMVLGSHLQDGALGAVAELGPELRHRLQEPGAVAVDEAALAQLGLSRGIGEVAEANGQRVRVVGLVRGTKGATALYVFCSSATARRLLQRPEAQTSFVLARCRDPGDAAAVVEQLRRHGYLSAYTRDQLSLQTRVHWLLETGGGMALAFTTVLGLVVGGVITSQTLYGATVTLLREFTVLRALGIPRRRIAGWILAQSFWIGLAGIAVALPVVYGLHWVGAALSVPILLAPWILALAGSVTLVMALLSGLVALRSLGRMDPAAVLH